MAAAISTSAAGSDQAREPGPGTPSVDVEVVPGGGDGKGKEERKEEEEHRDQEAQVEPGRHPPPAVPVHVEDGPQAQTGIGDGLEEVVAVVERARGDAPGQVQEVVPEPRKEPARIARA